MTVDQQAEFIGMMYDWREGRTEIKAIIAFIVLVVKQKEE